MGEPRDGEGLWVRSDVLPDGSYGVVVTFGGDHAWSLDTGTATGYAATLHAVATAAEHDAAMLALLTMIGVKVDDAALLLRDLRDQRARPQSAVAPLRFNAAVSQASREPFIQLELDGTAVGQISPEDLREHAGGVLTALAAAELDTNLHRALTAGAGLDPDKARAVITDLCNHWPGRAHSEGGH